MTDITLSNVAGAASIPDLVDDSEWMIVIEDEPEEDFEYCTCNACLVGFQHSDEAVCGADEDGKLLGSDIYS
jgi:hypothetical protein